MAAPPPRPVKGAAKPWLKGQTDDLASLASLDEAILLDELKVRYTEDKIYVRTILMRGSESLESSSLLVLNSLLLLQTYVGDILVAINPFKKLPLYEAKVRPNEPYLTLNCSKRNQMRLFPLDCGFVP
jgi:hypothetical protein